MRRFQGLDDGYDRVTAVDTSTVGGVTVAVAISTESRDDELAVLDGIVRASRRLDDFYPFRNKANDLDSRQRRELLDALTPVGAADVEAVTHRGKKYKDTERIEAKQTVVLCYCSDNDGRLVVLDGDREKTRRFCSAASELSWRTPDVTHCQQAELYLPTTLLADLLANGLAHRIEKPRAREASWPPVATVYQKCARAWNKIDHVSPGNVDLRPTVDPERRRGRSVAQRIFCWERGILGGGHGAGQPITDSTRQAAVRAENAGYERVAAWLRRI